MTQVFVWKSYGDIKVYASETPEQIQGILGTVYEVACQNAYDEILNKIQKTYEKNKNTKPKGLINWLIQEVGDDCDSFESGTGFYKVMEKCS